MAVAYLALVGFPLLTVPVILNVGRHLNAPPAVAGEWIFRLGSSASSSGCPWQGVKQVDAIIAQSGPDVRITLKAGSGLVLVGWLRGGGMEGHGVATLSATLPSGPMIDRVTATVQGRDAARTMDGSFSFDSALGCEALPFSATRFASSQQRAQ